MKVEEFVNNIGSDFYTGVPDSQLKALCDYLLKTYGIDSRHHIIAANEGNAVGLAAGYHLATGKTPVVYMQNSGEGNVINTIASLLNEKLKVYVEVKASNKERTEYKYDKIIDGIRGIVG